MLIAEKTLNIVPKIVDRVQMARFNTDENHDEYSTTKSIPIASSSTSPHSTRPDGRSYQSIDSSRQTTKPHAQSLSPGKLRTHSGVKGPTRRDVSSILAVANLWNAGLGRE